MTKKPFSDQQGRLAFVGPMLGGHPGKIPNPSEELAARLSIRGYDCLITSPVTNRYLRLLDIIRTILSQQRRIDIICLQVYGGASFVVEDIVSRLTSLLNKRLVMVLRGGALPEFVNQHKRWGMQVLSRADVLVTPSNYLREVCTPLDHQMIVIPNALDLEHYPFRVRTERRFTLAWLRAFHQVYSPVDAVETLAYLTTDFPNIRLVMMGPDERDGSSQIVNKVIQAKNLQAYVQITGPIPKADVPRRLAQHDILLNTTLYESFGLGVMEAAALGMEIVTTNVGELPYIWTNGLDAFLVPPHRPDQMAEAVRRILREPALAERLSRNARAKAEQYSWESILPEWEALFQGLRVL
jgi:glycosyltransferase involved in cell wall biosynthesis